MSELRVSILGASGYVGGEALRLLLDHPAVEVAQVTSERFRGKPIHLCHPNLRGRTKLKFSSVQDLEACDLLMVCLPHGKSQEKIDELKTKAGALIDMGADFRLADAARYEQWYGKAHTRPELLGEFAYGLPEVNRQALAGARLATGTGCSAAAGILGIYPLARAGLVSPERPVVMEAKFGSSAAGNKENPGSHHPERAGVLRSFQPVGHRHSAEIEETCGVTLEMSGTSYDAVRGILATIHVPLAEDLDEMAIWKVYREAYGDEPFVRIVKDKTGIHRVPEPKILAGSNYVDVGFHRDPRSNRLVVLVALDNLMKGAAGGAVQVMNRMHDFAETTGLGFPGLHPA